MVKLVISIAEKNVMSPEEIQYLLDQTDPADLRIILDIKQVEDVKNIMHTIFNTPAYVEKFFNPISNISCFYPGQACYNQKAFEYIQESFRNGECFLLCQNSYALAIMISAIPFRDLTYKYDFSFHVDLIFKNLFENAFLFQNYFSDFFDLKYFLKMLRDGESQEKFCEKLICCPAFFQSIVENSKDFEIFSSFCIGDVRTENFLFFRFYNIVLNNKLEELGGLLGKLEELELAIKEAKLKYGFNDPAVRILGKNIEEFVKRQSSTIGKYPALGEILLKLSKLCFPSLKDFCFNSFYSFVKICDSAPKHIAEKATEDEIKTVVKDLPPDAQKGFTKFKEKAEKELEKSLDIKEAFIMFIGDAQEKVEQLSPDLQEQFIFSSK